MDCPNRPWSQTPSAELKMITSCLPIRGFIGSLALVVSLSLFSTAAIAQITKVFPPRTVIHKSGKIGTRGGYGAIFQLPPRDEYYLDYTLIFRPGFDWIENGRPRGGKLPGLAGGTGIGGCRKAQPEGWSARQTWDADGYANAYIYQQERESRCGENFRYQTDGGKLFNFTTGRRYRITQRIKVNAPNVANGEEELWVDGVRVVNERNLRLRGSVAVSEARVSQIKYQSYFGGNNLKFAPARDSIIDYGTMYVMTCPPNLSGQPGQCR